MNRDLLRSRAVLIAALAANIAVYSSLAGAQAPTRPPRNKGGAPPSASGVAPAAAPAAPAAPARVHHKGKDPFYIPWTVPPPPPYVFDKILPVRLADPDVEPPPVKPVTIREEPTLRVSGIMTGDGVFAILEQPSKVDIVKPGSSVDIAASSGSRTYTVVSIKDDTVVLESKEGLVTYQQTVPLSDAPIGTNSSSFGAATPQRGFGTPGKGAPTPGSFGGGGGGKKGNLTPGGVGGGGGSNGAK